MRKGKKIKQKIPLVSRRIKTYKPEEILAMGGARIFSEKTSAMHDTQKAIDVLSEIALSEEEIETAIFDIKSAK